MPESILRKVTLNFSCWNNILIENSNRHWNSLRAKEMNQEDSALLWQTVK